MQEFDHLGHVLSAEGIKPNPDKVKVLASLPPPSTVKSLQRFLGLANWFRRFIPDFATIAAPLTQLLHKNAVWNWTPECDTASKSFVLS